VCLLAAFLALRSTDAEWVSFALLVLIPIVVPVGFVFVVGQAGMLLDVRDLKAFYARVVAGFALGFVAGGLAGPLLLAVLDGTEDLLAAAAVAATIFMVLVIVTRRRHPTELNVIEHAEVAAERPTLRTVTRNRYIMLIVAFQMLSAVESQWLDFLVYERAAQRYTSSSALANFISRFSATAYGTDILFLLVLAGLLLRRFGLRYGLTANALAVLAVLGAIIVAASAQGSGATIVFALIVAARVTDLTLSDGSSRTSLSAAYQAVPFRLRAVAQATVEGLAVPVAIGLSGVALLAVQSAGGADGLMLPLLTSAVVIAWAVVATLVYREYRVNLLANLRGRTLDPVDLTVESGSGLVAIDRLVESDDERDVRLGLDILTITQHPELSTRLQRLVLDERVNIRTDALERLVELAPHMAAAAARAGLAHPSPNVRAASIRVLGAAGAESDLVAIAPLSNDTAPEVKAAVVFALTRIGNDEVRAKVAREVALLASSDATSDRVLAASMLRECGARCGSERSTLRALVADADCRVVNAALAAVRFPDDADLVDVVADHVDDRQTAGASAEALVRAGDVALAVVDKRLRDPERSVHTLALFVRVGREIGGRPAVAALRRHIDHPNREVGLAVMKALAALGPSGSGHDAAQPDPRDAELDRVESEFVRQDLEYAVEVLHALVAFEDEPGARMQNGALHDELELVRQRVLAALSMRHGIDGMNRVVFQLAQRDSRSHALALEWLDVTLTGTDRAVIPMLEPGRSDRERLNALARWFPIAPRNRPDILVDLVLDTGDRWRRPWISACALYSASTMSDIDLEALATAAAVSDPDDEDGIVHETLAGVLRRRDHSPT
jgi:HEAT repeat protein